MHRKKTKYQPSTLDVNVTILQHFADKKAKEREKMAYVRSFIKNTKPRKYTDEFVSDVRTAYYASRGIKGFSLAAVAVLFSVPISTVRGFLFNKNVRKAKAAQINESKIPFFKAQMNAILAAHAESESKLREDRMSAKPAPYTTAEITRMHGKDAPEPLRPELTEQDYTQMVDDLADKKIFDAIDAIIGRTPLSFMEVAEAVNHYARTNRDYMSPSDAIALRKKYAIHHGL